MFIKINAKRIIKYKFKINEGNNIGEHAKIKIKQVLCKKGKTYKS